MRVGSIYPEMLLALISVVLTNSVGVNMSHKNRITINSAADELPEFELDRDTAMAMSQLFEQHGDQYVIDSRNHPELMQAILRSWGNMVEQSVNSLPDGVSSSLRSACLDNAKVSH